MNLTGKRIRAWHFLSEAKLPHGDNRRVIVGKTLDIDLPIHICNKGLHGSIRLIDALSYAPGNLLCRTEHSGTIQEQEDKICSSRRKVLWMGDIEQLLHEFACNEAELALKARRSEGLIIPVECDNAIKIKRLWLQKKASSAELSAAESAARHAARNAAESAAESAARHAAWNAAESAACNAAESAARHAAWPAAWNAARSAQNIRLEAAVRKFMKENPIYKG